MKNILITGINGSGGSYLAEHLLKKKNINKIFGTIRNKNSLKKFNLKNIKKNKKVKFLKCDLNNFNKIKYIIGKQNFDYIFHFPI